MEGKATPTRSVPLPVKEKEEETEEAKEKEKGGIVVLRSSQGGVHGGHAHHITLNIYLKY